MDSDVISTWGLILLLYVCSIHCCFQVRENLCIRVARLFRLLLVLLKVISHLFLTGIPHDVNQTCAINCVV